MSSPPRHDRVYFEGIIRGLVEYHSVDESPEAIQSRSNRLAKHPDDETHRGGHPRRDSRPDDAAKNQRGRGEADQDCVFDQHAVNSGAVCLICNTDARVLHVRPYPRTGGTLRSSRQVSEYHSLISIEDRKVVLPAVPPEFSLLLRWFASLWDGNQRVVFRRIFRAERATDELAAFV